MRANTGSETIHATCVSIDGKGVLLCGRSGSGKSDLALRLIDRGAMLVSDDYTIISKNNGVLIATAPPSIVNKLEVRGLGILDWPAIPSTGVALSVLLDEAVERLPDAGANRQYLGIAVPTVSLRPLEASTPFKIELAVRTMRPVKAD